jgi:hypothetical protein
MRSLTGAAWAVGAREWSSERRITAGYATSDLAPVLSGCILTGRWYITGVWADGAAWAGKLWAPNLPGGAGVDHCRLVISLIYTMYLACKYMSLHELYVRATDFKTLIHVNFTMTFNHVAVCIKV